MDRSFDSKILKYARKKRRVGIKEENKENYYNKKMFEYIAKKLMMQSGPSAVLEDNPLGPWVLWFYLHNQVVHWKVILNR